MARLPIMTSTGATRVRHDRNPTPEHEQHFVSMCAELAPARVRHYIESTGWEIERPHRHVAVVYRCTLPKLTNRELLFAPRSDAPDYGECVADALAVLGEVTGMSADDLRRVVRDTPLPESIGGRKSSIGVHTYDRFTSYV